jgi:hypothetical protein
LKSPSFAYGKEGLLVGVLKRPIESIHCHFYDLLGTFPDGSASWRIGLNSLEKMSLPQARIFLA